MRKACAKQKGADDAIANAFYYCYLSCIFKFNTTSGFVLVTF